MSLLAATRDPRFGRDARALAARCLGFESAHAGSPGLRVAFQADGLHVDDLEAIQGAGELTRGAHEAVWRGSSARLRELVETRAHLAPLLAAAESATAPVPTPRVMGIVNVTPDSFSDGGRYLDPEAAVAHGVQLVASGADIIDVGGESTRPGSEAISVEQELARIAPVIERLAREIDVPISIDTTKAEVAARALDLGARFVNDVSAGTFDAAMLPLVAERGVPFCVMHMQGTPRTMQAAPRYANVVSEVHEFLRERAAACLDAGVDSERIVLDPGIGFGKLVEHNVELLARLGELRSLGLPLLLGVSNKSFLGRLLDEEPSAPREPTDSTGATAAAVTACVLAGAEFLRVHDVPTMAQAVRIAQALRTSPSPIP